MPKDTRNFLEKKFNLPPLAEINSLLQSLDMAKMKDVQALITELNALPLEKYQALIKLLPELTEFVNALQKLIKMLPPDMMRDIKFAELVKEVKGK
jgi:hypothetical protein